jgi:transcriptional regulator GlxA family with amidase domain
MQIAIALFPEFTALDAIGPYQVFAQVPGSDVVLCAAQRGRVADDRGILQIEVEHDFGDVDRPDVLVVPGGVITRRMARDGDPVIDWITATHPHTTYTTSVCTGALLLGAAGLLEGLPATTHWFAYDALRHQGAIPTEQRVVMEGKIATAAGVSAGIDLAFTMVGKLWGPEMAQAVQLGIEYDPQPPYDSGAPSKAAPEIRELVATVLNEAESRVLSTPT